MTGNSATIASIVLLVLLGVAVLLGAKYAQRTGRLRSRGARMGAVAAVALLALLLWVGPGMFLLGG